MAMAAAYGSFISFALNELPGEVMWEGTHALCDAALIRTTRFWVKCWNKLDLSWTLRGPVSCIRPLPISSSTLMYSNTSLLLQESGKKLRISPYQYLRSNIEKVLPPLMKFKSFHPGLHTNEWFV